jgi:hypothetical protein
MVPPSAYAVIITTNRRARSCPTDSSRATSRVEETTPPAAATCSRSLSRTADRDLASGQLAWERRPGLLGVLSHRTVHQAQRSASCRVHRGCRRPQTHLPAWYSSVHDVHRYRAQPGPRDLTQTPHGSKRVEGPDEEAQPRQGSADTAQNGQPIWLHTPSWPFCASSTTATC